jgi:hypothetical protein
LSPTEAGIYYISVASVTIGLTYENPTMLIIRASPADARRDGATGKRASAAHEVSPKPIK